ncbi:MAG TPA: VTT domain-containing protein [Candidatus Limnocylindrales bacterium]|nr:VTT domain-containing protein [Candidatus Limnocylindrales bacterium]
MKELFHLLTSHPYAVVLLSALLERIGLPLLLSPVLVGAGALAAAGQMRFDAGFWVALIACVAGDSLWYEAGRTRGDSVLSILCRISFEPDTCVRKSKVFFEKGASRTLFFSKWLPGVSHIIPAVAGLSGIEREHFQVTNISGSAVWVLALMMMGYLPVEHMHLVPAVGAIIFEASLVLLAANVGIKYAQRRRFLKELYKSRIAPAELHEMLNEGKKVVIVDLRHSLDSIGDPRVLPGAIRMLPEEVGEKASLLPRDEEIVLYCT